MKQNGHHGERVCSQEGPFLARRWQQILWREYFWIALAVRPKDLGGSAAVAVTILPLLVRLASRSTGRATLAVSKGGEDVAQWPMSPYWCVRASVCAFTLSRLGLIYINCAAFGGRETNLILRAVELSSLLFRRVFCRRECGVFVDPRCHICFWSAKLVWLWYKFSATRYESPTYLQEWRFLVWSAFTLPSITVGGQLSRFALYGLYTTLGLGCGKWITYSV